MMYPTFYIFLFYSPFYFVRIFCSPYNFSCKQITLNSHKINSSGFVSLASDGYSVHFSGASGSENRVNYILQFKEHYLLQTMKTISFSFPFSHYIVPLQQRSLYPFLFSIGMHFKILCTYEI